MNASQACSCRLNHAVALGATLMLAAGMSACNALKGENSSDASVPHTIALGKTLTVSTPFHSIQCLAESISGKLAKVSTMTPSNVEPHDFEPSGKETVELGKADIIAYVPGSQPSLDRAVKEVGSGPTVVDLSKPANLVYHEGAKEEHEHGEEATNGASVSAAATAQVSEAEHDEYSHDEYAEGGKGYDGDLDPHFWPDPGRMVGMAEVLEASFAKIDPVNANDYEAGLDKLKTALTGVDNQYKQGLTNCQHKTFTISHAALGYMAECYGLTQASISGIDPKTEPSPVEMANIRSVVEKTGAKTIFTEELASDTPAKAIAAETGAETSVLSPLESKPEQGDYTDTMTTNLERLKSVMVCK